MKTWSTKLILICVLFYGALFVLSTVNSKEIVLKRGTIDTDQEPWLTRKRYESTKQYLFNSLFESQNPSYSTSKEYSKRKQELNEAAHFLSKPQNPLVLMQFKNLTDRIHLAESLQFKMEEFGFIDSHTWATRVPLPVLDSLASPHNRIVSWIGHLKPEYKSETPLVNVPSSLLFPSKSDPEDHDHLVRVEFIAELMESSYHEIFDMCRYLNSYILSLYGDVASISWVSDFMLSIEVVPSHIKEITSLVTSQESVVWISPRRQLHPSNRNANYVVQGGIEEANNGTNVFWEAGITGRGQIVGCADTGIDYDNCFFHDPSTPLPKNTVDHNHRKIVAYYTNENNQCSFRDGVAGHGTHVTGSIAGAISSDHENYQQLKMWNGVAYEAKLAFTDIGIEKGGIRVPRNLSTLFENTKIAGGFIHSFSFNCKIDSRYECKYDCRCTWVPDLQRDEDITASEVYDMLQVDSDRLCESCNKYGSLAQETDRFLFHHPDQIILFSAGNDGALTSTRTVGFPATSKNAVAVGNSYTARNHLKEAYRFVDYLTNLNSLKENNININTESQCCNSSKVYKEQCCPQYVRDKMYSNATRYNAKVVDVTSSHGPATRDQISKPDVLAPGNIVVSMHSDGDPSSYQCGTMAPEGDNAAAVFSDSGTSMATPATAGAAALIRQYFTDGYYPTGDPATGEEMEQPSGMLIKAALIHSTDPIPHYIRGDGTLQEVDGRPSPEAGMGVVNLSNVLPIASHNDSSLPFNIHVYDHGEFHRMVPERVFTYNSTGDGHVQATMVYYDPPPSALTSNVVVNQLNLTLEQEKDDGSLDTYTSVNPPQDPAKHVDMYVERGSPFKVRITAERLYHEPQPFALIVTGPFSLSNDTHLTSLAIRGTSFCWLALLLINMFILIVND
eukprot:gb/GECH01013846.1/.p1 GENE.gb/GECH01013846.1/~~gb/GECH01013846.1/.p1  ORF type:complete len:900 (+),score=136.35 gb/GECH01013846.1/:1-2700(+)